MAINQFLLAPEFKGQNTQIISAPEYTDAKSLAISTAESFTVPSGADIVIFSAAIDFYAKVNDTASVPGDTSEGSASQLNPAAWYLTKRNDGTEVSTISVISETAGVVTASYYKLPR